jgi:hypothetical protein
MIGSDVTVPAQGLSESALFVDIPADQIFGSSAVVVIEVLKDNEVMEEITTSFVGPRKGSGQ